MEKQKVKVAWADNKDDFSLSISDGEWIITKDNELRPLGPDETKKDFEAKESFLLFGLATHHTTDWLRFFCEEHHPEVDFDKEFETDEPGVFARYEEKFGHDYEDWVAKEKYQRLKELLAEKGYELPW